MKLKLTNIGAICLLLGAVPVVADTLSVGDGDPFEITFNATGTGTIIACNGPCTFGAGADNGTAVANFSGLGGNGFEFALPESVGTGIVDVLDSSSVLEGVMDFGTTSLTYLTSGNLAAYSPDLSITAGADGTFTFNAGAGPFPVGNTYNGSLSASAVPEPGSVALLGGVVALSALAARRKLLRASRAQ